MLCIELGESALTIWAERWIKKYMDYLLNHWGKSVWRKGLFYEAFHLRGTWSDGLPLTAISTRYSLRFSFHRLTMYSLEITLTSLSSQTNNISFNIIYFLFSTPLSLVCDFAFHSILWSLLKQLLCLPFPLFRVDVARESISRGLIIVILHWVVVIFIKSGKVVQ